MPPHSAWRALVERAIAEDLGPGDVTSQATLSPELNGSARIEAREPLIVCGLELAREVFRQVDPTLEFDAREHDGAAVDAGSVLAFVSGNMRALLVGERSALNFLARLCGIASATRRYVEAVAGTRAQIVDTRKTLPGWRVLDKYACAMGGGVNHRVGLYDGVLLKDNHIAAAGGVEAAVKAALANAPAGMRVQVEVESHADAEAACGAGADFLLIDNASPDELRGYVERWGDQALLEASGGITLDNVRAYAETGVQRISIGALTHSVLGSDLALEIEAGGVAR
jgi:nicotinate-nucleotide pyrophosphorylase (carboxylating)